MVAWGKASRTAASPAALARSLALAWSAAAPASLKCTMRRQPASAAMRARRAGHSALTSSRLKFLVGSEAPMRLTTTSERAMARLTKSSSWMEKSRRMTTCGGGGGGGGARGA
jgi:sarcosine oxidase gamma subunit